MNTSNPSLATLGGGCFWCLDAVFRAVDGVQSVASGYSGGWIENPSYDEVCAGSTGHAEVVQIQFHPSIVSYRSLLEIFFLIHDPTTLNRQGNDIGPQYRSIILTHDAEQVETAEQIIEEIAGDEIWGAPIVTEIRPATTFWHAEDVHQDFVARNPQNPYCAIVATPKVVKARRELGHLFIPQQI